jgi:hypothetical protein
MSKIQRERAVGIEVKGRKRGRNHHLCLHNKGSSERAVLTEDT